VFRPVLVVVLGAQQSQVRRNVRRSCFFTLMLYTMAAPRRRISSNIARHSVPLGSFTSAARSRDQHGDKASK